MSTDYTRPPRSTLVRRSRRAVPANRPWRALRNYNYRLYFSGQLITQSGAWLQRIAQAWLVLDLTDSPFALGAVWTFQFLPILLLSLISGVIADRVPKRRFLIVMVTIEMVQALVLAGLVLLGQIQLWQVYALALVLGVASAFEMPTRQAFVSEMVEREDLQSAVGLNSSVFNAARIIGPGIGGVIIATWGVGWAFLVNGVSFVGVVVGLLMMRTDQLYPAAQIARAPLWKQLGDGISYVKRTPTLMFPLIVLALMGTFGYNFGTSLPLLARYSLDVGSVGFGTMNAALGFGSLFGALFVAARAEPTARSLIVSGGIFALLLLLVAATPWYGVILCLLVALGLISVTYSASTNTILQLGSREEYRGRVLSIYTLLFAGSTPIGGIITGALADAVGIQLTLAIEAALCAVGVGLGLLYLRLRGGHEEPADEAEEEEPVLSRS